MKHFFFITAVTVLTFCNSFQLHANSAAYEQRRLNYIDTALAHFSNHATIIQAYKGLPVDQQSLTNFLNAIPVKGTADFDIVELVRILYFSNGTYDNQILPVLDSLPFWLTKGDTLYGYWSENHMIMWMSSDWLLHEKYGWAIDDELDTRLRHYLKLKVQYGFYEFFSSVYGPYCLSGLLNLADFSQDQEIKDLATQASVRLLKDFMMLTNDKGVYFPIAGRNYPSKYENAWGQNHSNLTYLLTGFGPAPYDASHSGAFLATSSINVDSIEASWTPELDVFLNNGHSLDSVFSINDSLSPLDKVLFQWSFGGYLHPLLAQQTAQLLHDSALWDHSDWAQFKPFESQPIASFPTITESLSSMSKSTVICKADIHIFKHHSVTLSSVEDFWKGKLGFQQHTIMANVGTTAVYTGSGEPQLNWDDRPANNANEHLPMVKQHSNVALIMYRPEPKPSLFGFTHDDVALHFKDADFDEIRNDSLWLLGRQQNGYVAVRRSCTGTINGVRACPTSYGQSWVIIVGDSAMYGNFDDFETKVTQSQFEENWYWDSTVTPAQVVYYAHITFDTTSIEYAWGRDSVVNVGIKNVSANNILSVYPNPTQGDVTIDVSGFTGKNVSIKAINTLGQQLYSEQINNLQTTTKRINTEAWAKGIYLISVEVDGKLYVGKMVRE
jgi:hypothetical protein